MMHTGVETLDLIAACAFGLEAVVRRELQSLGIEAAIGQPGRVHFPGTHETICQANLWLRTADRVLIRVAKFPAPDFDALFETTRDCPWGALLPPDASFPVTGRSIQSTLTSVPACQRAVKRAIVDAMRRDHATAVLPETGAEFKIDVALLKDTATLTIDTTGRSLHRRGYRTQLSKFALKETLAAALVLLSYWKRDRPLLDPFCGSGTIPIEAAMIGRHLAPGLNRGFALEAWPNFPPGLMAAARQAAAAAGLEPLEERIVASDSDARILTTARENAQRAGVETEIHFQAKSMLEITSKRRFGCMITQPPSPETMGDRPELDRLYAALPDVLRKLPTWSHYILSSYPDLERAVGRSADRRRKLYNNRVECTYYQFHGPKPVKNRNIDTIPTQGEQPYLHASGPAAFGQLGEQAKQQAELFSVRLQKRARHLRRWPSKRGITCFRLYERDIPEIPLVVDRYEDYLHITEYERPHDRDPAQHLNWLDLMAQTAATAIGVPRTHVFIKSRRRQRGKTQHAKVAETHQQIEVHEGGLKFLVNLADYVDTGLFLDHRLTRQMVRQAAAGTTFLNLFAYTGAFTVYAAAGGAKRTVSVDLSRSYLDWAWQNMRLNGFTGNEHTFLASDVGQFVRQHAAGEVYDLVVLDPPTFSNSKRTEQDWEVQNDAASLLNDLLPLVRPGGIIYFSNNFRRFRFDPRTVAAAEVHEISNQTVPEDFRNRRIHRCWRIVR
jgi:23S rRNA (guanine2445-N2)-methyltransferase / 23S rRNA (guanine2069-N7)-methyltransferase